MSVCLSVCLFVKKKSDPTSGLERADIVCNSSTQLESRSEFKLAAEVPKASKTALTNCYAILESNGRFIQSDRTGLIQSERTGIGQLLPGPRTKNNWPRLKVKLLDVEFAHGESSISCLEWAGIKRFGEARLYSVHSYVSVLFVSC